jgi:hypothetical protein
VTPIWTGEVFQPLEHFVGSEIPEIPLEKLTHLQIERPTEHQSLFPDRFPSLHTLILCPQSELVQSSFRDLLSFSKLARLSLPSLETLEAWGEARLPSSLTHLELLHHRHVSSHFMGILTDCCVRLERLELMKTKTVEANALWNLSRLVCLTSLCIASHDPTDVKKTGNPADVAYMPSLDWMDGVIESLPPSLTSLRIDWQQSPESIAALKFPPQLRVLDLHRFSFPITSLLQLPTTLEQLKIGSIALISIIEAFFLKDVSQQFRAMSLSDDLHVVVSPSVLTLPQHVTLDDILENPLDLIWGSSIQHCPSGSRSQSEDDTVIRQFFADKESFEAIHPILPHLKFSSCHCLGSKFCQTKWPYGFLVAK